MDAPRLTEDEMAEIKKDVLIKLRPYLCDKIRAERHLDFLRSRRILTRDDAEEISCRTTQTKRTGMLLEMLSENPRGLDALIDSIQQSRCQNFIITRITDEVQKAKNDKIESLRAATSSSSSDTSTSSPGTISTDLSRTFSNDSTMILRLDDEKSSSILNEGASIMLPSLQRGADMTSVDGGSMITPSVVSSSSLPRPGDHGAPALPEDQQVDSPSSMDPGAQGCTSNGGDLNFQPLRSRSLTPTSNRTTF